MNHLSKSQISLYLDCSLKYRFQYVDALPKPFKPSGLAFGSAIHSALEWLHKQLMRGSCVSLDALLKIHEADWYSQKADTEIQYKEGETWQMLLLKGREMLSLYFQEPVRKALAAEYPFEVPLVHPVSGQRLALPIQGVFDLIEEGDGIVEFKTAAKSMDHGSVENNLQLTIYAYAYYMLFKKEPQSLKLISLIKNRSPKIETLTTTRGQKDFQRLFYLACEVYRGIHSGIFYPRYSFLCKDCEYALYCRDWQGN